MAGEIPACRLSDCLLHCKMMLHHCNAVKRGAKNPLIVADLPFGSYEVTPEQALSTAIRVVKESGVDAVKLEGGADRAEHVRKIANGGIAVMGHVGLLPQSISVLGGFRAQGRTAKEARALVDDALALQVSSDKNNNPTLH